MPKEYFSHDYNARNDPKCVALIKDFGIAGYGVYWCLIEIMNEQGGKIKKFPSLYRALAHDIKVKEATLTKQIEAMLHQYKLLVEDDEYLWSDSVLNRLSERESKRMKKSVAGKMGGLKSGESRNSKQNEAVLQANEANEAKERKEKGKEREKKGNESREKGIFPTIDFEIELDENKISQAVEYLSITKHVKATKEMVASLWTVFKTKNFTGEKFYKDEADIKTHFFNSLKFENLNGNNSGHHSKKPIPTGTVQKGGFGNL